MAISRRVRFEVLKRDRFTCRYCGRKAFVDPEVLLEVRALEQPPELQIDHVHPRARDGSDDMLNLVTACVACNAGKRDVPLSEHAELAAQGKRLEELEAHREQLRMMLEWKRGLRTAFQERLVVFEQYWSGLLDGKTELTETGRKTLKTLLRNRSGWTDEDILEAMDIAVDQYVRFDEHGGLDFESVELAWKRIRGICRNRKKVQDKPYWDGLLYARGILRNRLSYVPPDALKYLEQAYLSGVSIDELQSIAKASTSWQGGRGFEPAVEDLLASRAEDVGHSAHEQLLGRQEKRDVEARDPDIVDGLLALMPPIVREEHNGEDGLCAERMSSLAWSIARHSPVYCGPGVPDQRQFNALLGSIVPEDPGEQRHFLYNVSARQMVAIASDHASIRELVEVAEQTSLGDLSALELLESPGRGYSDFLFREALLGGLVRKAFLQRFPPLAHDQVQRRLESLRVVYGVTSPLEVMQYLPRDEEVVWEDVQNVVRHVFGLTPVKTHVHAAHYLEVMRGFPKPFDAVLAWADSLLDAVAVESWADFAASERGRDTLDVLGLSAD